MKLIKMIPVVLMGIVLSANVQAATTHENKFYNPEMTSNVECWMFDTNYLSNVAVTIEAWMFDENWLVEASDKSTLESWMLDEEYLAGENQEVESWMLDEGYLKHKCNNVN